MKTKLIIFGIILLLMLPLSLVVGGVACYLLRREYYSEVTLEVKPETTSTLIGSSGPLLTQFQIQIIRQKEILYPVIDSLKLVQSWSPKGKTLAREEVYMKLLHAIVLKDIRNTDLIIIGVYDTNPKEAADVANSIAVVYQEKRRNEQVKLIDKGLAQLEEEITIQRKKVDEWSKEAARIRAEEGIADPNPETLENVQNTGQNTEYTEAKSKYIMAMKILEQAELKYNSEKMQEQISRIPVKIWSKAAPAIRPARPNVAMIMMIGFGAGCLFAFPGGLMLTIGLLLQKPPR